MEAVAFSFTRERTTRLRTEAIDYDQLLLDYRESLREKLRGFRANDDAPDFLEMWVPSDDDAESIAALFDAASSCGRDSIAVRFGVDALSRLSRDQIVAIAKRFGDVSTEGELEVRVRLAARAIEHDVRTPRAVVRRTVATVEQPRGESPYDAALANVTITHEGELPGGISVRQGEVQLSVSVDRSTHTILAARHRNAPPGVREVLDLLCRSIEGTPVAEAADHAAIRVEHALRRRDGQRVVSGIVTPDNADPRLRFGAEMMRAFGRAAYAELGAPLRNEWDPSPGSRWSALTHDERVAEVQRVLSHGAHCLRIERDTKVIVALDGPAESKPHLLMELERTVKETVDPTLSLWLAEASDLNVIRRLAKPEKR
jgi:hypothetical protein